MVNVSAVQKIENNLGHMCIQVKREILSRGKSAAEIFQKILDFASLVDPSKANCS